MIDTIKSNNYTLENPYLKYWIDEEAVATSGLYLYEQRPYRSIYRVNHEELKHRFDYIPYIEVTYINGDRCNILCSLTIQFSAPKLIYGSNLFQVSESDWPIIKIKLKEILNACYINVTLEEIDSLKVTWFAVCFNCLMPDCFGNVVDYLKKYFRCLDQGKHYTSKMNQYTETVDGISIHQYSTGISYKEYYQAGCIINNKHKTQKEKELAILFQSKAITSNVLRLEKTFQRSQSTKRVVNKILQRPIMRQVLMADIFNDMLCKRILIDFIDKPSSAYDLLIIELATLSNEPLQSLYYQEKLIELLKDTGLRGRPLIHVLDILKLVYNCGENGYKKIFDKDTGPSAVKYRSYIKCAANKKLLGFDFRGLRLVDIFQEIRSQVNEFIRFKSTDEMVRIFNKVNSKERVEGEFSKKYFYQERLI